MILEGSRYDLRGGSGIAIDEGHHGKIKFIYTASSFLNLFASPPGAHDDSGWQEKIRDLDGLIEKSPRI